mmetsp:Transcript_126985/g.270760  ORF Transcript_126985/g.270760 Transcript_126985/m.270760 type:complete len:214 (-) Transcript_126985:469-1110(-)
MGRTPAVCAGPPASTWRTMTPSNPRPRGTSSGSRTTPIEGACTKPLRITLVTLRTTESMGMARPTPEEVPLVVRIALFTPITVPELSSRGPPLLPGLMAASVWMMPFSGLPLAPTIVRETPLITPLLKLCSMPMGLPRAKTCWPTMRSSDEPQCSGFISPSTQSTATSATGSVPTRAPHRTRRCSAPLLSRSRTVTMGLLTPLIMDAVVTTWF